MAENSKIEWTDATWNIITGCTLVDEGCRNCYAANLIATWPAIGNHPSRKGLAKMNAAGVASFTGEVRFNEQWLDQPLRWKKPRRIFVCAHGDLFHEAVPDEWIDKVFAVMALCPQHTFQCLTKRPRRAREYLTNGPKNHIAIRRHIAGRPNVLKSVGDAGHMAPLPNVWLGTSASDQASADARIPDLLAAPAAVRFLSAEPLLGPIDLVNLHPTQMMTIDAIGGRALSREGDYDDGGPRLDWVIVGGESGPNARPMHPDWARSLRDQCQAAGVAFFFKQWGEWADQSDDKVTGHNHRILLPTGETIGVGCKWGGAVEEGWKERGGAWMTRVGKKRAGRLLDGREWNEVPRAMAD